MRGVMTVPIELVCLRSFVVVESSDYR